MGKVEIELSINIFWPSMHTGKGIQSFFLVVSVCWYCSLASYFRRCAGTGPGAAAAAAASGPGSGETRTAAVQRFIKSTKGLMYSSRRLGPAHWHFHAGSSRP